MEEEAVEVVAEDEVAEKVEVDAIGEDPGKRANLRAAVEVTGEVEGRYVRFIFSIQCFYVTSEHPHYLVHFYHLFQFRYIFRVEEMPLLMFWMRHHFHL